MRQHALDHCQCPPPFVEGVRSGEFRRFEAITALGVFELERERNNSASAFLCVLTRGVIRQEVLQGSQQEGAEAASILPEVLKVSPLEQRRQKTLGQVAGVVRARTSSADVGV